MAWNEPGGNGKDPWGNRKDDDQEAPDLDELVKKMQDRLGGLFGGGGDDDGPSSSGSSLSPKALIAIVIGVLLIWSLFGFYTVQPAERGVELLFGKHSETTEEGLRWRFPYPLGRVFKVNVKEVRSVSHKALMLTQDENIVSVELEVQYYVGDASAYLFNVREPDHTLHQATESALREVVGTASMDDVLTVGRAEAAIRTKDLIQEMMERYQTGLLVQSVNMQNAQPPSQVQAAFDDAIKAREDEERHKNQAEAYANEVIPKAGGDADQMREQAKGYKAQMVAHAEGETQRFLNILNEYQKAPEVTRRRMYLETVEAVLGNTSKVMVDIKQGNALMYLPLDKLMDNTGRSLDNKQYDAAYGHPEPGVARRSEQRGERTSRTTRGTR